MVTTVQMGDRLAVLVNHHGWFCALDADCPHAGDPLGVAVEDDIVFIALLGKEETWPRRLTSVIQVPARSGGRNATRARWWARAP